MTQPKFLTGEGGKLYTIDQCSIYVNILPEQLYKDKIKHQRK